MLRKAASLLLLILLAATPAVGQDWAGKMFKVTTHDFGSVARGAKIEFAFELSNIYLEDVHIVSVRSSCGCTSPRIENSSLKTYESGAIVARYNTHAFTGRKGATVTVTFDKPFYTEVQLHVTGNIRSDVVVEPGSVELGTVDQGDAAEKRVTVRYLGRSDWRVLEVESANPHISARAVERYRGGGQVAYDLIVQLAADAPAGYLKDHLMLRTNDRYSAQVPVLVEGQVQAGITVSPSSLFMGVVEPGQKVTKRLVVRGKKPFRILSISCDDESFQFDASAGNVAKPVHIVPVTFVAGADTGKVVKTIRIETDLGSMTPELAAHAVVSSK
ncbi:MAG TPA: DUF1573 domain-containing protein [Thermoguttaceae bacterium]|nr:DUF1573 domain-containing protein [Thermoguttaceae bacterium]